MINLNRKKMFLITAVFFVAVILLSVLATVFLLRNTGVNESNASFYLNNTRRYPSNNAGKLVKPIQVGEEVYIPLAALSGLIDKRVDYKKQSNTILISDIPPKVTRKAKPGDIIGRRGEFQGFTYEHYGVCISEDEVVHYVSQTGNIADTTVLISKMKDAFPDGEYFVLDFTGLQAKDSGETIERAMLRLKEKKYDIISNNCESFAFWCKTGVSRSYQIERLSRNDLLLLKNLIDSFGEYFGL